MLTELLEHLEDQADIDRRKDVHVRLVYRKRNPGVNVCIRSCT